MYENVIVPFDGSLPGRIAFAPAADLAWRCNARIVVVNNTEVSDTNSQAALKSKAMSLSGQDVDFWVDTEHDLGEALVAASGHRAHPIICIPLQLKTGALRRKATLSPLAEQVFEGATCPVLTIGPKTDTSRGLPMTELVVGLDGSAASEDCLHIAAEWARTMKLGITLLGVVAKDTPGPHTAEIEYLEAHANALRGAVPEVGVELREAQSPIEGLLAYLHLHEDTVLMITATGRGGPQPKGGLGSTVLGVLAESPRGVVVVRPR